MARRATTRPDPVDDPAEPSVRRSVGRPAVITRQRIAEAAYAVGLDDLTMKGVADQLGVSVAGLYHHVEGKDDLFRLAAEYAATTVRPPVDRHQHWAAWLLDWAIYNRDVFLTQPALLGQYLDGAISAETIADRADAILGLLLEAGFDIEEAQTAYEIVSTSAIGFAIAMIRENRVTAAGHPTLAEQHRVVAQRPAGDLPNLRRLIAARLTGTPPSFDERMTTIIVGIGVGRGDDPDVIRKALRAAARRSRRVSS